MESFVKLKVTFVVFSDTNVILSFYPHHFYNTCRSSSRDYFLGSSSGINIVVNCLHHHHQETTQSLVLIRLYYELQMRLESRPTSTHQKETIIFKAIEMYYYFGSFLKAFLSLKKKKILTLGARRRFCYFGHLLDNY